MREWNAGSYDRVGAEMTRMGLGVLERASLRGDEVVVDAGCGTAKVTAELVKRVPGGRVIAVDGSEAMAAIARERLGASANVLVSDLLDLKLDAPADVIFSTATLHWITDHDALFARLRACLRDGGRLVAQCGGERNLSRFGEVTQPLAAEPPYGSDLQGHADVRNYASAEVTESRLRGAGFSRARAWLTPETVRPDNPREFLETIILAPTLQRLEPALRDRYLDDVIERMGQPFELDYVRLNIDAVA